MLEKARHFVEYICLATIVFAARLFAFETAINFSSKVAVFAYYFIPIRKSYVLKAMRLSFPNKHPEEIKTIAKNMYKNFLRTIVEIIFFPTMSDEQLQKLMIIENEHLIDEALSKNNGGIIMSAHFGNWELTALSFSKKYPLSVIVANQSNKFIDSMIDKIRTKQGFNTISRDNRPAKKIFKALNRNELVAILADQDAGKNGIFIPFLDRLSSMPRGPALFAIRAKCPVIVALGIRQDDGVMRVTFFETPNFDTGNIENDIRLINTFYAKKLEEFILKAPQQWFWFHKKWKTQPRLKTRKLIKR
ncbi:MAG: lysophospholipid acyltransferase family protein [Elusimicrobiota bacterium]|jgi:KDO2-lipid IV(A) lauroyltransferase|nr:lysophospholipid acyltransferase family protein [Elusimicrobiota bacterium]